jgi:hypothetical protein
VLFGEIARLASPPLPVPPELRAALYRLAAQVPRVKVVQEVRDRVGRAGVAVELGGSRMIFDPKNYGLLETEFRTDSAFAKELRVKPGTLLAYATVTESGIVDSILRRPDGGRVPVERPSFDLAALQRLKRFRLYYLGNSFEGFPLAGVPTDKFPGGEVAFLYGYTKDGALPIDIQNWSACDRNPSVLSGPKSKPTRRFRIGDAAAAEYGNLNGEEGRLEVYTGKTTVKISTHGRRRALRAAAALRTIDSTHRPTRLPPPALGFLSGHLKCGQRER